MNYLNLTDGELIQLALNARSESLEFELALRLHRKINQIESLEGIHERVMNRINKFMGVKNDR